MPTSTCRPGSPPSAARCSRSTPSSGRAAPTSPTRWCASVDEPSLHRPARELVAGGELELAQDGRDVGLDRLDRDAQARGYLLVEVAARYVAQHLPFARRELVELGVDLGRRQAAREGVEHEAGQARG